MTRKKPEPGVQELFDAIVACGPTLYADQVIDPFGKRSVRQLGRFSVRRRCRRLRWSMEPTWQRGGLRFALIPIGCA